MLVEPTDPSCRYKADVLPLVFVVISAIAPELSTIDSNLCGFPVPIPTFPSPVNLAISFVTPTDEIITSRCTEGLSKIKSPEEFIIFVSRESIGIS